MGGGGGVASAEVKNVKLYIDLLIVRLDSSDACYMMASIFQGIASSVARTSRFTRRVFGVSAGWLGY